MRVSGGDLCIRKYAEAPTEPVGETLPPPWVYAKSNRPYEIVIHCWVCEKIQMCSGAS